MLPAHRQTLLALVLAGISVSAQVGSELEAVEASDAPAIEELGARSQAANDEQAAALYERAIDLPVSASEERVDLCKRGIALLTSDSAPDLAIALHVLCGDALLVLERFEDSCKYQEVAASLARESGDKRALMIALYNKAFACTNTGRFDRALETAREVVVLAGELNFPQIELQALNMLGVAHDRMGDREAAIRAYSEALGRIAESGQRAVSYQILSNLSVLHMNAGRLEEALDFFERGLVIATEAEDFVAVASTVANIGDVHFLAGRFQAALEQHSSALELRRGIGREVDVALSLSRIGDIQIELGDLESAIQNLERARDIQKRLGLGPDLVSTLSRLSRAYSALDRDLEAIQTATESNQLAQAIKTKALRVIALTDLAAAHEASGEFEEALAVERAAFELKHQVNTLESTLAFAELTADAESRLSEIRKNGEIAALERDAELARAELERQALLRNALIAGGVFILMLALLGWSSYLFKRRANEALERSHRSEKRLLEAQKLESLGLLSGGVAHDFNNILTVISGNSELARIASKGDDRVQAHLFDIETACKRATEVAQQMLFYSGKNDLERVSVDFEKVTLETVELLKKTTAKNIRFLLEFDPDLPAVLGDRTQLGQVVLNLITNAVEAIGDQPGEISTRVSILEARSEPPIEREVREGTYLKLEISDTGVGIDESQFAKLFDPFYSGKPSSHGLGLATVQGIVRRHGGTISVQSAVDSGSVFTVLLPSSDSPIADAVADPVLDPVDQELRRGCALVVDDEREVLKTTGRMLSVLNWDCHLVDEAEAAFDSIATLPEFDLVILDLVMPGADAIVTLAKIKSLRPRLPVLLVSGFDRDGIADSLANRPDVKFLQKPFDMKALGGALDEISRIRAIVADSEHGLVV